MAQLGVVVAGTLEPTGHYAVVDVLNVKGGYRAVDTVDDMNAIYRQRRSEGMLVYINSTGELYRYERTKSGALDFVRLELATLSDVEKTRPRRSVVESLKAVQEGNDQIFYLDKQVYLYNSEGIGIHNPIRLYINGIRYFENEDFFYNADNNTISWRRHHAVEGQENGIDATATIAHIEHEI